MICDGDVCERKPVTSPKAMQTAVDASEGFVEQHAAAADTNTRDSDSASVITPGGDGHGEERNQSDDAKAMDPGLSQLVSEPSVSYGKRDSRTFCSLKLLTVYASFQTVEC